MIISKITDRIQSEIYEILQMFFSLLPGIIGKYTRIFFYRFYLKEQGEGFFIGIRCKIQFPENVRIGNRVGINDNVWIAANKDFKGGIIICDNVLIGPFTIIHSGNHNYENPDVPIVKQGFRFGEIIIEEDTWIAARCTILSGVTIGKGSVVAAGSVVTKDVPPFSIIAGVPAKIIGSRKEKKFS